MENRLEGPIFLPDKSLRHHTFGKDATETLEEGTDRRQYKQEQHHPQTMTLRQRRKSVIRTSRNTKHHSPSTVKGVAPLPRYAPRWRMDLGTPFVLPDNCLRCRRLRNTRRRGEIEGMDMPTNNTTTNSTEHISTDTIPSTCALTQRKAKFKNLTKQQTYSTVYEGSDALPPDAPFDGK
ncbi:hypothetical protein J3458_015600 [Metarhizium acridum]|uniref:uncharacterized protein n=1 Tax=Metarhizium acridum TaxID=92637 RepID=UPI001C6B89F6|nr:hypothetical protein J3458_015600 [Metarhizium acridum]